MIVAAVACLAGGGARPGPERQVARVRRVRRRPAEFAALKQRVDSSTSCS